MNITLRILACWLVGMGWLSAQEKEATLADSLAYNLDTAQSAVGRMIAYNDIAWRVYGDVQGDSMRYMALQAIEVFEGAGLPYSQKLEKEALFALYLIGRVERMAGNYSGALARFQRGMGIIRDSRHEEEFFGNRQVFVGGMIALHGTQGNADRALDIFHDFLGYVRTHAVDSNMVNPSIFVDVSVIYREMGVLDSALQYAKMGVEFFQQRGQPERAAEGVNYVAKILTRLGQYEEANQLLREYLPMVESRGSAEDRGYHYHAMAVLADSMGDVPRQVRYAELAVAMAREKGSYNQLVLTERALARAYVQVGRYQEGYDLLLGSVENEEKFNSEEERSRVHHEEVKDRENRLAMAEQEQLMAAERVRQKNWMLLLIGGLLGLALLLVAMGVRYGLRKRRLNEELRQRNAEIVRQKEELESMDAMKSRFFANISHELRTPLTLISSPVQSLLGKVGTEKAEVKGVLERVDRNARQLRGLVDDILDLARLEVKRVEVATQPTPVASFLSRVCNNYDSLAQQMGLVYGCELQIEDAVWLDLDRAKVERVLNNLLSNAIKHTAAGGRVTLKALQSEQGLMVLVEDTGQGIASEDIPYVFERYFQSKQPDAPLQGGTGIGLAIAKELVELMGGAISVESVIGEGSTFSVVLPYTEVPAPAATPNWQELLPHNVTLESEQGDESESIAPRGDAPARILVVEDHPDMRDFIADVLGEFYEVLVAEHGLAACALLERESVDMVVSDVMMPQMDGYSLLQKLKNSDAYRTLPVVMLTALDSDDKRLTALTMGVDDYLTKPFSPPELVARVHNLVGRFRERTRVQGTWLAEQSPLAAGVRLEESAQVCGEDLAWLQGIEQMIGQELENPEFNVHDLAQRVHLSDRQFRRKLSKVTGLSPKKYQQEVRLQAARSLLEKGGQENVTGVAFTVGFSNISRFSREYEDRFGKRPADYFG